MTDTADTFARYRSSRSGPAPFWLQAPFVISILALFAVGTWIPALPRVMAKKGPKISGPTAQLPDGVLTVVQFDVGQGDATFMRTPGGYNILIDCGEGSHPENEHSRQYAAAKEVVIPFLQLHGIYSLDALILTHPDSDHGGGMAELIDWIYENGGTIGLMIDAGIQKPVKFYKEDILAAIDRRGIKYLSVLDPSTGKLAEYPKDVIPGFEGGTLIGKDVLGDPSVAFQVLGPVSRIGTGEDQANNNSVITRIRFGDISLLSAGDAEQEEEEDVVRFWGNKLQSTIHFAPHHGSKTSDHPFWLRMVNPEIISTSSHPPVHGHPAKEVIEAWKASIKPPPRIYLRTDMNGDIWYRTDGKKLAIRTQFEYQGQAQWAPAERGQWKGYREFASNPPTTWEECKPVPRTDEM